MITKQGKKVNLNDILLYNVNKDTIIAIVNDEEQMKKFSSSGRAEDAPVVIIPYTDEKLVEIISSMKEIKSYNVLNSGSINVKYTDGTTVKFDSSNEKIIRTNLQEQRKNSEKKQATSWYNISEDEKNTRKKETQKKVTRGLAAVLAAAAIAGSLYSCSKMKSTLNDKESDNELQNSSDSNITQQSVTSRSEFTKEAENLYQETLEKNDFILKYQQVANVKWDKDLALEVIEYMNGFYPTAMTYMTEENAKAEAIEIQQAINLLIAGNLNPSTKEEDMIDLSKYIVNEKERVFIYNAMTISRACIQESIGEPMNGKILDESQWSDVNKFSRKYTNSVDQLLHYEFDTINDPDFLTSSAGARFVISSIFQNINNTIPQWSYITRESSEQDQREYDLYYRYFFDDVEKITYLPEPGKNGTNQYVAYWQDEKGNCHKEGPYTEDVMHAMAGLSLLEEQRNLGIEANPNIRQLGIQTEVDNRVEDARNELFELRNSYDLSK